MSAFFVPHILQGRRYLVTGATGGAGSAAAVEISRCGGLVTLLGRDVDKLGKVMERLNGPGHGIHLIADSEWLLPSTQFDGIFHAAGLEMIAPLRMAHADATAKVMHPTLDMAIWLLAAPKIVKDGGSIVMMSSVAAVRGTAGMALYSAAKGAIEALVRSAAVEMAPRRVRVNAIRAGAFASPMHNRIAQRLTPEQMDDYAARHPLGIGKSDDIAHAALFLLSDAARWITGSALTVDGGYSAK